MKMSRRELKKLICESLGIDGKKVIHVNLNDGAVGGRDYNSSIVVADSGETVLAIQFPDHTPGGEVIISGSDPFKLLDRTNGENFNSRVGSPDDVSTTEYLGHVVSLGEFDHEATSNSLKLVLTCSESTKMAVTFLEGTP